MDVSKDTEEKKPARGILKTSKVAHGSIEKPRFDETNIKETHPHEYEQSETFIPGTLPGPSNSIEDEELARRLSFLYKRKLINNEFYAAKLERLVRDEDSEDEEVRSLLKSGQPQSTFREPKTPPPSKSSSPAEMEDKELGENPREAPTTTAN